MNSFYRIFSYHDLYLDGGDKTMNFDGVKILMDVPELNLSRDQTFDTCWFNLRAMKFHFIVWNKEPDSNGTYNPNPKKSVKVDQKDLSVFCVW